MELAHQLGGFYVDRVLIGKRTFFNASDEGKIVYMLRKLVQGETNTRAFVNIVLSFASGLRRLEYSHGDAAEPRVLCETLLLRQMRGNTPR